jgi:cysteine synthase A
LITPGKTVLIDGTSGNMGIAQAWTAAIKGYKLVLVMPHTMTLERVCSTVFNYSKHNDFQRILIKAYGAQLVLTDAQKGITEVLNRVNQLAELIPNSFALNQVCFS